jgi:hypothetical protein
MERKSVKSTCKDYIGNKITERMCKDCIRRERIYSARKDFIGSKNIEKTVKNISTEKVYAQRDV